MAKKNEKLGKQKRNSLSEIMFCLFCAAGLLILGISGIHQGSVTISTHRRLPGVSFYGEEATTLAVAAIACASVLILWLCRHRTWLPQAIGAALTGNIVVAALAFN